MNAPRGSAGEAGTSKRAALLIATLASFLTPFMGSSTNIALPSIGREFGMSAVLLSWIATAYLLSAAMTLLPLGKIADIYGRKKIFLWGITVYTVMSLCAGISRTAFTLIFFRVLQGIGGAMIFGTAVAILTSIYPPGERGRALGVNVAAVYLGLSCGPIVGGFLTEHYGWRSIFLFNIPFGFAIVALTLWKLRGEWAEARGERFDVVGSVIYGVSLVAVMYGFSMLPGVVGVGSLLAGVCGIAAFVAYEKGVRHPLINIDLFRRNTVFAFSNLAALINYSATSAVGFLLSLYLQVIKALSPQEAGLVMVAQPVVMALFSPFAGKLSDRVEPQLIASLGMGATVAGLLPLIFLGAETPMALVVGSLVLLGCGFAFFSSPNTNAVMSSVEKRLYGVASATVGTMRLLGQMLSMGIAILLFALYGLSRVQLSPETSSLFLAAMKSTFSLFAVMCFAGIFASLARGKVHGRPGKDNAF